MYFRQVHRKPYKRRQGMCVWIADCIGFMRPNSEFIVQKKSAAIK